MNMQSSWIQTTQVQETAMKFQTIALLLTILKNANISQSSNMRYTAAAYGNNANLMNATNK
jgi:hypothetical protein